MKMTLRHILVVGILLFVPMVLFAQAPGLKIGLVADAQYCNCETSGTREYRKSAEKLREAVKVFNSEKVNFTVELGDLIDRDFASFSTMKAILGTLSSAWIFVPGNHDFNVEDSLKKSVWKMAGAKKGYWSQVIGEVRLVYLNGFQNSVAAYGKSKKDYVENIERLNELTKEKAKNAFDWNGGLGKKQLAWLKTEIEEANQARQKLIIFCHQPPIPGEAHSLWDSKKLIKTLSGCRHKVLYICGHKHSGGDDTIGNIRIINLKGMVEGTGNAFSILDIYPDRWEVKGYGNQGNIGGSWNK
jgi:predicted phosphodiesterase